MIKFIIRDSIRSIKLKSIYPFVRVFSLSVGLICFSLFLTILINEYSFDRYHENKDKIFRLILTDKEQNVKSAILPGDTKDIFNGKIPQVEEIIRMVVLDRTVKTGENDPVSQSVLYADPGLFNVFSWKLIDQDGTSFLESPDKIYISQKEAKKIFKEENPLGKIITINNTNQFTVGGIFEDIPAKSFIKINYLISTEAIKTSVYLTDANYKVTYFFFVLKDKKLKDETENILTKIISESFKVENSLFEITLQPVADIYLHSGDIMQNLGFNSGNIQLIQFLPWIALFILIIALGNYMILDLGKNISEIFRIGISKTYGETRKIVFARFYFENLIYISSASFLSSLLVISFRNTLTELTSGGLSINELFGIRIIIILIILTFIIPLIPAFYSSSLVNNITIPEAIKLKKSRIVELRIAGSRHSINLRRLMLGIQFFTSIGLIAASLIAGRQINYIATMDLGFEKKNLIVTNNYLRGANSPENRRFIASQLVQNSPLFTGIASASNYPLGPVSNRTQVRLPSQRPDEAISAGYLGVDFDFFKTIGAAIVEGRDFSRTFSTDSVSAVIINQQLAKRIGDNAIGKKLIGFWGENEKIVVGVVKDIYFGKTDKTPSSMAFVVNSTSITNNFQLFFKTADNMSEKALEFLSENWKQIDPVAPFSYFFMDDQYNNVYSKEMKVIQTLTVSTIISLFLLLLGIISVSYLISTVKVNEMAIRRILGADTNSILKIFLYEYIPPFIVASCLAVPLVYLLLNEWLTKYVNKTKIGFDVFLFAIVVIAGSFLIISGIMTYKITRDNPVNNLRYE
ncbi:MAG: ABC transporter permease [Ignavibacteriales bacterium]|nr:MAG: ABC transporter permease [Ignavibacteriales bacterium]